MFEQQFNINPFYRILFLQKRMCPMDVPLLQKVLSVEGDGVRWTGCVRGVGVLVRVRVAAADDDDGADAAWQTT